MAAYILFCNTSELSGYFPFTTVPAAITHIFPIFVPFRIIAHVPIQQSSPISTLSVLNLFVDNPPGTS